MYCSTELLYVYVMLYYNMVLCNVLCVFWNVVVCTLYNWSYQFYPVSLLYIYCAVYIVLGIVLRVNIKELTLTVARCD